MFKSLSIAQLKWKAVYTLCGCFFLSANLAIDYSLQRWIWEFSFWGSRRCSPPNWSTKSIESTLIGSQSFIPQGHLRIVSYNFRQNNVVIYSKRTCLPGQFHSAHDTVCKDFPAQEIGAKTAHLINGHTCSVAISWTSTTCFGTITPRTPSRPLRFWNYCSIRLLTKWVEGWRLY